METGNGSFTIGLNAGNSLVNCCSLKTSIVTCDTFIIFYSSRNILLTAKNKQKWRKSSDINRKWSTLSLKRKHNIWVSLKKEYNKYYVNINNWIKRVCHIPNILGKKEKYQPGRNCLPSVERGQIFQSASTYTADRILLSASLKRAFPDVYTVQFLILCDCRAAGISGPKGKRLPLTMTKTSPNTAKCPPQGSAWLRTTRVKDRNHQLCVTKIRWITHSHQHRSDRAGNK